MIGAVPIDWFLRVCQEDIGVELGRPELEKIVSIAVSHMPESKDAVTTLTPNAIMFRYQFAEILIQLADKLFVQTKEVENHFAGLTRLLDLYFEPWVCEIHFGIWGSPTWVLQYLYEDRATNTLLTKQQAVLKELFNKYSYGNFLISKGAYRLAISEGELEMSYSDVEMVFMMSKH